MDLSRLLTLSESTLLALILTLTRPQLAALHKHCGLRDDPADVDLAPCPCGRPDCDCLATVAPQTAPQRPDECLPMPVAAEVLRLLHPAEYADRPQPRDWSAVMDPRLKVAVMEQRAGSGEGLWHPEDYCSLAAADPEDRMVREVRRMRNGSDVAGEIRLTVQEQAEAPTMLAPAEIDAGLVTVWGPNPRDRIRAAQRRLWQRRRAAA